jgi:hypothetical protein
MNRITVLTIACIATASLEGPAFAETNAKAPVIRVNKGKSKRLSLGRLARGASRLVRKAWAPITVSRETKAQWRRSDRALSDWLAESPRLAAQYRGSDVRFLEAISTTSKWTIPGLVILGSLVGPVATVPQALFAGGIFGFTSKAGHELRTIRKKELVDAARAAGYEVPAEIQKAYDADNNTALRIRARRAVIDAEKR